MQRRFNSCDDAVELGTTGITVLKVGEHIGLESVGGRIGGLGRWVRNGWGDEESVEDVHDDRRVWPVVVGIEIVKSSVAWVEAREK